VILTIGVLAMSSASILIRFAGDEGVPSLVIAAYRLTSASLVLAIPAARQRVWQEYAKLSMRNLAVLALSGILLSLHFAAWITSFKHTSVLSSVVLVTTTPLWIGLVSPFVIGEKTGHRTWIGIACATAGGVLIGLANFSIPASGSGMASWGDLLALLGAIFAAGYLLIGRRVRNVLSLLAYLWIVYAIAAVVLTGSALLAGYSMTGYPSIAVLWMIALGLVPQLIGHSAANYAIRYLPASVVAVTILGEPVGATVLAIIILHEWPRSIQLVGAMCILGGIAFAAIGDARQQS
jgi:drug/metabolite transporter (DMT)-like permease